MTKIERQMEDAKERGLTRVKITETGESGWVIGRLRPWNIRIRVAGWPGRIAVVSSQTDLQIL